MGVLHDMSPSPCNLTLFSLTRFLGVADFVNLSFSISLATGYVIFLGVLTLVGGVPIISKSDISLEEAISGFFGYDVFRKPLFMQKASINFHNNK